MTTTLDHASQLAQEGLEFVMAHGLVRYRPEGGVGHLPFSLHPWQAPPGFYARGLGISPLYNKLYHRVSRSREFLDDHLQASRAVDEFVQGLYSCLPEQPISRPWLYLSRHDFMPAQTPQGVVPKQVETNLMAASLGYASQRVNAALRFLYADTPLAPKLLAHRGGSTITRGLAMAYRRYASPGQVIFFIVPSGEVNAFDQRAMQAELVLDYGIPVMRTTLEQLGGEGQIVDGKVTLAGKTGVIAYFRAGYSPDHYLHPDAWKGRKLLEHSETISIPSVTIQLANTKKVQQVLADRQALQEFVDAPEAQALLETMVILSSVDGPLHGKTARQVALEHPDDWVLKPSREGGGNNYFGADMVEHLKQLSPQQAQAFVLMEAIKQEPFRGIRLVDEKVIDSLCVTELGYFTYALFEDDDLVFEDVEGYLLRTKDVNNHEGLVLGGYSYLDAAVVEEDTPK